MRIAALVALLALSLTLFVLFPDLDIATSRLFYDGAIFPIANSRPIEALRRVLYAAEDLMALFTVAALMMATHRKAPVLNQSARDWLFQLSIFLLGPGLMVNLILKPLWGRVRPYHITDFGGPDPFTPVWTLSHQCLKNCSFPSGEMAGAMALTITLMMILHANPSANPYRLGQAAALSLPLVTAWQRIAAGRHFLSDILFSALAVPLIAALLALLFYPEKPRLTAVDIPPDSP